MHYVVISCSKENSLMQIHILGAFALLFTLVQTILSYPLAASQPALSADAREQEFFRRLLNSHHWDLLGALYQNNPFKEGGLFLLGYCGPLLIVTVCFVSLLIWISRQDELDSSAPKRIYIWSIIFALISAPAFNVLTQDIWLSVAWGRMVDVGINPYTHPFLGKVTSDLPLDYRPIEATYGPLWIFASSVVTAVAGDNPIASWIIIKLVLLSSWLGCLWLVYDLSKSLEAPRRCWAMASIGWLPAGLHSSVAEGHNDVVMVLVSLFWLKKIVQPSPIGPVALATSVLVKYVTAPFAVLDLLFNVNRRMTWLTYLRRVSPALLLMVVVAVVVLSFGGAGTETASMATWSFLEPAGVLRAVERLSGLSIPGGNATKMAVFAILFGGVAIYETVGLSKQPKEENMYRCCLSAMCLVLFVMVGHVWPWFFVWCIPFAALCSSYWLAWFVLGAAMMSPFSIAHWWHLSKGYGEAYRPELLILPMYLMALCAVVYFKFSSWSENAQASIIVQQAPTTASEH
jgi:hypothetical protein